MVSSDICNSRRRAILSQGWFVGELFNRIGIPFSWVDGSRLSDLGDFSPIENLIQYLCMSGEIYEIPESIRVDDYDKIEANLYKDLQCIFGSLVNDRIIKSLNLSKYFQGTANVKAQDCSILKSFCPTLFKPEGDQRCIHIDIGPGLGANSLYSLQYLKSRYIAWEAFPASYQVQRDFFGAVAIKKNLAFNDWILGESHGLLKENLSYDSTEVADLSLVPSWNIGGLNARSADLITATWVLNELTVSGIHWIMFHASRLLKPGGYFYIRDSKLNKPGRHQVNYDEHLTKLGFQLAADLNVENRVDLHGVPRILQKVDNFEWDRFDEYIGEFLPRDAVYSHGGRYQQNVVR